MSGNTRIAVLTPPGTGAIATVEIAGPGAWEYTSSLFRPAGKPLPDTAVENRFWFGKLGAGTGDEVIVGVTAIEPEVRVEVHCHGGQRVVRWIVQQFLAKGCVEAESQGNNSDPWHLLTRAPTLRTASILLDQAHGAFAASIQCIKEMLGQDRAAATKLLGELTCFASLGKHLVDPWKVVIAGPPNVGKSSLVNALAGFQRAIVSEIAGTTRDVVTVQVAFDGWPVELTDTAGLRAAEGLEAEGIERARRVLRDADLVVWVMDSSQPELVFPDVETREIAGPAVAFWLIAMNKSDIASGRAPVAPPGAVHVSAVTKAGIPELIAAIISRLVPHDTPPGAAVPYSAELARRIAAAEEALRQDRLDVAMQLLRDCLPVT